MKHRGSVLGLPMDVRGPSSPRSPQQGTEETSFSSHSPRRLHGRPIRPSKTAPETLCEDDVLPRSPARHGSRKLSKTLQDIVKNPDQSELSDTLDQICAHCGNVFMSDAVFCRRCGKKREDRLREVMASLSAKKALHPKMEELLAKSSSAEEGLQRGSSSNSIRSLSGPNSRRRKRSQSMTEGQARVISDELNLSASENQLYPTQRSPRARTLSNVCKMSVREALSVVQEPTFGGISPARSLSGNHSPGNSRRQSNDEEISSEPCTPRTFTSSPFQISKGISASSHSTDSPPGGHTPAGSRLNSRRPSRVLDAADGTELAKINKLLDDEKHRQENEVGSRAYNDDDSVTSHPHSRLGTFAPLKVDTSPRRSATDVFNARPRSLAAVKRALDFSQAAILITWVLSVTIAAVIALQSAGMLLLSKALQNWRLEVVEVAIVDWGSRPLAFILLLAYALVSTLVTSILVAWVAPRAAGSGLPDVKAFLNGNNIPQLFGFRTWAIRCIGLVLVTSSGLAAGMQGPSGHLGAAVSMGIASITFRLFKGRLSSFGHRTGCEFVAMGTAVGVAAAFSAPVGGILFAMEEASSFWNKGLTWRSFVGCMVAAAIVKFAKTGFRELSMNGFIEFPDSEAAFQIEELLPFTIIAVGTSLIGASFCALVERVFRIRLHFYDRYSVRHKKPMQVLEAVLVAVLTMIVCFWVPVLFGCSRLIEESPKHSEWFVGKQAQTICDPGGYSGIGMLLLGHRETSIEALFTYSFEGGAHFETGHLFLCAAIIFFLTVLTYGTVLPVGLFVPNIMVGACFGRGIGQLFASLGFAVHPGVHALVGAAGMLAGFSRMTVSLTVLVLEIANSLQLLLPVLLAILISKALGDRMTDSVYDLSIKLHPMRDLVVLKGELDEEDMPLLRLLTVHDACSVEVQTLRCEEYPGRIMATLAQTKFSGFPLVSIPDHQVLGLVLRSRLVEALNDNRDLIEAAEDSSRNVPMATIDLLQYADTCPEVKHWNTPLAKAHRHFVAAGLRHLCIVDEAHRLAGILTRSDLVTLSHPRTRMHAMQSLLNRKDATIKEAEQEAGGSAGSYSDSESESEAESIWSGTASQSGYRGRGFMRWSAY